MSGVVESDDPVERHRDTLEALAESDLDIQLVEDARRVLKEADDAN